MIGLTVHQYMSWRECASAPRRSNRPTGLVWSGATAGREAAVALSVMPSMCSSSAPDLGVYRCNEAGTGSGRHVRQQGPSRYPGRQICQVRVLGLMPEPARVGPSGKWWPGPQPERMHARPGGGLPGSSHGLGSRRRDWVARPGSDGSSCGLRTDDTPGRAQPGGSERLK